MGISPGWGDEYHHSTEGQDLDITNPEIEILGTSPCDAITCGSSANK